MNVVIDIYWSFLLLKMVKILPKIQLLLTIIFFQIRVTFSKSFDIILIFWIFIDLSIKLIIKSLFSKNKSFSDNINWTFVHIYIYIDRNLYKYTYCDSLRQNSLKNKYKLPGLTAIPIHFQALILLLMWIHVLSRIC